MTRRAAGVISIWFVQAQLKRDALDLQTIGDTAHADWVIRVRDELGRIEMAAWGKR